MKWMLLLVGFFGATAGGHQLFGAVGVRDLPDCSHPGEAVTVRIAVSAPQGTFSVVVEDRPPIGWVVSDICSGSGGTWDPINKKVKWGPFFSPFPTSLCYDVTPPEGTTGQACFLGIVSLDGLNQSIGGDGCLPLCCTPEPATSLPPNCAIDAREPHLPDDFGALVGWNSVAVSFDVGCAVGGLEAGDFTVSCVAGNQPVGACPTVTGLSDIVGQVATLNLSGVIPAGSWTCIAHAESGKQICLGSLPGDTNGDRTSTTVDILDLIDNLSSVRVCPGGNDACPLAMYQCDIDGSGLCAPADILSEIDLLNGANGFLVWNGMTLPDCPAGP